jgi:hypothetical protein
MTCGAVDTNDAALVRQGQKCISKYKPIEKPADQICEGEVLGGPARVFATPWNQQIQQHDIANARYFGKKIGTSTLSKFVSVMNV